MFAPIRQRLPKTLNKFCVLPRTNEGDVNGEDSEMCRNMNPRKFDAPYNSNVAAEDYYYAETIKPYSFVITKKLCHFKTVILCHHVQS